MSGTLNSTAPEPGGTGFLRLLQLWWHGRPHRYFNRALLLIGIVTLIRLGLVGSFELLESEASYWLWSKHLDIAYLSNGPLIAWVISISTSLFGQSEFGIRFFAVILGAASGVGLFLLTRRLFSPRAGFYAVVTYLLSPLATLGGVFMTVDPLGIFFWIWAAYTFWLARSSSHAAWWGLTGLLLGLGMLSQYINLLQLGCFILFCLFSIPDRGHFRRRNFWLMFLPVLLCALPLIAWNQRYDWIGVAPLLEVVSGTLSGETPIQFTALAHFILEQSLLFSPLLILTMLALMVWAGWRQFSPVGKRVVPYRREWLYLICLCLPPLLFFLVQGLQQGRLSLGVTLCSITGCVALAAVWTRFRTKGLIREWLKIVLIVSGVMTTCLYVVVGLGPSPYLQLKALQQIQGSRHFALVVSELQKSSGANYIVADRQATASLLSFYLSDQPTVHVPYEEGIKNQFSFWPSYVETQTGENSALYLSDQRRLPDPSFVRQFRSVDYLKEVDARHGGILIRTYHAYFCNTFIGLPVEEED